MGILVYHITHINNFRNILMSGGIYSYTALKCNQANHISIAYQDIQDKREHTIIIFPDGCCYSLHDFVPFHFAPRSPMLYTVSKGNVSGYTEGQEPLIYIVADTEKIASSYLYAFTDGHPVMACTNFYYNINELNSTIDWDVMRSQYWYNTSDDPDRKRRRQAEFLVWQKLNVSDFSYIAVQTPDMQNIVNECIVSSGYNLNVICRPGWYY